jgi:hypothetical protein
LRIEKYAALLLLLSVMDHAHAADTLTPRNASAALTQLQTAFSAGKPVTNIRLSGNATWHSGTSVEEGSATLQVASNGAAQIQLNLEKSGIRTETQTAIDAAMSCQWSMGSQTSKSFGGGSCWKPVVWFLPTISLQTKTLPINVGVADYGLQKTNDSSFYHLQSQLVLPDPSTEITADTMQESTVDISLDPGTFLPSLLSYNVHPDDGSPANVLIEVRYSNYQNAMGAKVPFHIQRYVNGSLQLDLVIQSAQVN